MVREDECELHGVVETGAFEADDPRRSRKGEFKRLDGLNTRLEDRDPASTFVNPAMRVHVGLPGGYKGTLTSDDVLIVPELLCGQEDLSLYHNMVEEIRHAQAEGMKDARWASWKDGCHLINKAPDCSATYRDAVAKIIAYFRISAPSMYSRFNWYASGADWKPLHHDTAAFSQRRLGKQNITVGVSLGGERELAFRHVSHGSTSTGSTASTRCQSKNTINLAASQLSFGVGQS
ncbi:unnamed protein product [Durusdinium trenchii]|uniref:Uncharacterized protein n=1 Tax=Durusdinium trenchii TaxID=1381693 RepID=A0ABP0KQN1_9DINO